jgi:hypothetical protein
MLAPVHRGIQVRPFPRPLGRDGRLPLLSSCADIVHSTAAHVGSTIKNNYFVNSGAHLLPCHRHSSTPAPLPASDHPWGPSEHAASGMMPA